MRHKRFMLPYYFSRRGKRKNTGSRVILSLILLGVVFIISVLWIDKYLRPIISQLAEIKVDYIASKAINEAINKKITFDRIEYDQLVHFEKDIYGQITALKTDMTAINRLKTEIAEDVLEELHNVRSSELSIPLGNVVGGDLFSGRGPAIPIRIVPLSTARVTFDSRFTSAGINQTRHQIVMIISVDISVLLPGYSAGKSVTTQVGIAETVIVGNVPESYFSLEESIFKGLDESGSMW